MPEPPQVGRRRNPLELLGCPQHVAQEGVWECRLDLVALSGEVTGTAGLDTADELLDESCLAEARVPLNEHGDTPAGFDLGPCAIKGRPGLGPSNERQGRGAFQRGGRDAPLELQGIAAQLFRRFLSTVQLQALGELGVASQRLPPFPGPIQELHEDVDPLVVYGIECDEFFREIGRVEKVPVRRDTCDQSLCRSREPGAESRVLRFDPLGEVR